MEHYRHGGGYKKWDTARNRDYSHPYKRNEGDGDRRDDPRKDSQSNSV